jgi:hypothetical protein
MGRLAFICIGCGILGAPLAAQAAARTYFEERLLDRAPVVVRARFDADQSCFDVDVAAFLVKQRLRGDVDARVLVLGSAQLSKQFKNVDRLLFLKRETSGCLYRVVDVIDLVDEADAIEALVRGYLALGSEVDPAKRRTGLKQLITDGLSLRSEFPRKVSVREADRLARRLPSELSIDEIGALAKLGTALPPDEAARLTAALDAAEDGLLGPFAGTQSAVPRGPKRTQYLRSVRDYLQDSDPARRTPIADQIAFRFGDAAAPFLVKLLDDETQRAGAAIHLGTLRRPEAAPRILALLRESPKEPGPLIESLGCLGDETAVQPVSKYLSSPDYFETAALALVRIGSPSAKRILDGLLGQLKKDPRQSARSEWLEKARSKDFLEEDTERRTGDRGRYARE